MKKAKYLLAMVLSVAMLLPLSAQRWGTNRGSSGEGPLVRKSLDLPAISGIDLAVSGNVYVRQGSSQSVEVEAQANIIELLSKDVSNGNWRINFTENVRDYGRLNVYITMVDLKMLAVSGSGNLRAETPILAEEAVKLIISGSGDIQATLEAKSAMAVISGSGGIALKGKVQNFEGFISGSGHIDAFGLVSTEAQVTISGSGNCEVNVADFLQVTSTGSGNVYYSGSPRINSRINGSGDVVAKDWR
jgi:hypothetical protein